MIPEERLAKVQGMIAEGAAALAGDLDGSPSTVPWRPAELNRLFTAAEILPDLVNTSTRATAAAEARLMAASLGQQKLPGRRAIAIEIAPPLLSVAAAALLGLASLLDWADSESQES